MADDSVVRIRAGRLPPAAPFILAAVALIFTAAAAGARRGQSPAPVGYITGDRVVELAATADGSIAAFTPSPEALASLAALIDPVLVRMFLRASRPSDLKLAAEIGRTAASAANPALSVEFVVVSDDLTEPKGPIADNGVTQAPEIIVYWMGAAVGRIHPEPFHKDLPIDCKRCHGPDAPRPHAGRSPF